MHHMGIDFGLHEALHFDAAHLADPRQIVSRKVDEHEVLGRSFSSDVRTSMISSTSSPIVRSRLGTRDGLSVGGPSTDPYVDLRA